MTDQSTTTQPPSSGFTLPSKAELAAARRTADTAKSRDEDDGLKPGRVLDLDYTQWAAAIVDLAEKPDRIEHNRRRHAAKGYVRVGGSPVVMGFPKAEVWVISREDYEANRAHRREKIERAIDEERMSETALAKENVVAPRRRRAK